MVKVYLYAALYADLAGFSSLSSVLISNRKKGGAPKSRSPNYNRK